MIACFIGHRKISVDENFVSQLKKRIEQLIVDKNFDAFLFGSRSEFNDLCLEIVTELQNAYPKKNASTFDLLTRISERITKNTF